jgi:cysteine desulfurase/selenocysteine lyase
MPVDVQDLDCDFYAFSGHKVFGPSGVGILYGKASLLESMPPYQGGGEMIRLVTFEKTIYAPSPHKFEAGTPNITGAVGLAAALQYVRSVGLPAVSAYERELLSYATEQLARIPQVRIVGQARQKAGLVSFVIEGVHPHDVGTILDREGIAIRAGHHCAQPVMQHFELPATVRASFAMYNTKEEVDALVGGIYKVLEVFA